MSLARTTLAALAYRLNVRCEQRSFLKLASLPLQTVRAIALRVRSRRNPAPRSQLKLPNQIIQPVAQSGGFVAFGGENQVVRNVALDVDPELTVLLA